MGLDRVRMVLQRLVEPGPDFRVVSVAGTNGKGSTTAMLDAILRESGYVVGRYTSPHLVHYNERICVNGEPADDRTLCEAFTAIEAARADIPLTYFEFSTLAALFVFCRSAVDIAVLEVGMGGRLDAVNVMDADVAVITNIAIDHVKWLGATRERIALEKAGIMRPTRPVVMADPFPPKSVLRLADEIEAPLFLLDREFGFSNHGDVWDWWGPEVTIRRLPRPSVPGAIQIQNAAGVLMTVNRLQTHCRISAEALRRGLRSVSIPGRFQVIEGSPEIILDVAHNPAAAQVLAANLNARPSSGRTLAVFGVMRDKDVEDIVLELAPCVDRWLVGTVDDPRGAVASEVARRVRTALERKQVVSRVSKHPSISRAFIAAQAAVTGPDRILVFGSFHAVGDILAALK